MVQQCSIPRHNPFFVLFVDQIKEKVESIEEKLDKLDKKLDTITGEFDTTYTSLSGQPEHVYSKTSLAVYVSIVDTGLYSQQQMSQKYQQSG